MRERHKSVRAWRVADYDLDATLNSGQVFGWQEADGGWEGVVRGRWVRLRETDAGLEATILGAVPDWHWLEEYLQMGFELEQALASFPRDEVLVRALTAHRGLRLLRQDPWECLACFILSSTKQIIQIRQMVALLSERYGDAVAVPRGHGQRHAFPGAKVLASVSERALRGCRLGFRAPYLLHAAQEVSGGELDLAGLKQWPLEAARARLMDLPGVGRKIADCVLLFALGFDRVFPMDVWILRGLRAHYFEGRAVSTKQIVAFVETHFGGWAGYAQQYLFHYLRMQGRGRARMDSKV